MLSRRKVLAHLLSFVGLLFIPIMVRAGEWLPHLLRKLWKEHRLKEFLCDVENNIEAPKIIEKPVWFNLKARLLWTKTFTCDLSKQVFKHYLEVHQNLAHYNEPWNRRPHILFAHVIVPAEAGEELIRVHEEYAKQEILGRAKQIFLGRENYWREVDRAKRI